MEQKSKLEELHQQKLNQVNDLIRHIDKLPQDQKEKVQKAHEEWLLAWNKLQEVLLYLERFEI
jgi:hypothetical protein